MTEFSPSKSRRFAGSETQDNRISGIREEANTSDWLFGVLVFLALLVFLLALMVSFLQTLSIIVPDVKWLEKTASILGKSSVTIPFLPVEMPGGFLISVSLLIFSGILFAVARQRIINNPTMQTAAGCPSCQDYHLVRVHRNRIDRLISSIGIPFARYQCRDCQWNGLRIKQEQRFSNGVREMVLIQTTAGPINEQALSGNQSFSTQKNREIASVSPNNKSTNQQSFELQNLLSRKDTNATSSSAELISWEVPLQEDAATEKQKTARVGENVDDSNCGKIISPLGLNLRKDPRSDGEVVVTLEPGTIVELLDSKKLEDGIIWRQIRVDDDKNGWVLDSFLGKCI